MTGKRGFTLLEMIVATTIMGIAVAGLMSGISSSTRNAARLRDYDRVVQLARLRMNSLLTDPHVPGNRLQQGLFDPAITGGLECGWRSQVSVAEKSPTPMSGGQRRSFPLDGYRRRTLVPGDFVDGVLR